MRIRPTRASALLPAAAILAAIILTLAGCQSPSTSNQAGGGQAGGAPSATQQLSFNTPAAGATVTSPVTVSLTVTGAQIGQPQTGKLHLHLYVDDASQYTILYATKGQVQVPQGAHTLKAVLAQPNHSETSVTASQQVEVSGAGQAPATTTDNGSGGYDYGSGNDSGGGDSGGYGYP
jgi:hypothetical protein